MKKIINKKSVIEKGGLMIEALAMLGLIAVVTPTMYKKSAERTMEVEDINTASAIRSYMNSWNDLVAAHYIDIMEVMSDEDAPEVMTLEEVSNKVKQITADSNAPTLEEEFKRYLPYGYKADKDLYNYGKPKFAVARSGNNLTAFMVFPSKTSGDDSIGQERTVRIASLIGSNGGYVRDGKARGVGGTWSLDSTQLGKISDQKGEYSIVTSSVDAINSSTGGLGQDNEKYLQRTAENGELWRNMMHTDIYMGNLNQTAGNDQYGDDRIDPDTKGFFSVRNINQLIVGADGHPADSENDIPADENLSGLYLHNDGSYAHKTGNKSPYEFKNYALYVADGNPDQHGVNAYIAGSLEAAAKKFFVDENEVMYDGPRVQLGNYKDESGIPHYLIHARTTAATASASNESAENDPAANVVKLLDGQIVVSDKDTDLGSGDGFGSGEVLDSNKYHTRILASTGGFKGADNVSGKSSLVQSDGSKADIAVKYNQDQTFPVMVDSNMIVNGVMAAGQVDAQHLRSASLSTGSDKIDDAIKWMDVDKDGVHIRNRDGATMTNGKATTAKSQVEINKDVMAMRFDNTAKTLKDNANFTEHSSQVLMDQYGIEMRVRDTDTATERKVGVGTDTLRMEMEKNEMRIGGQATTASGGTLTEANFGETNDANVKQYRVKYNEGGHVDMAGTTLQVADSSDNPIFTVRGNDTQESGLKGTNYNDPTALKKEVSGSDVGFKIAGHGNTLFTSSGVSNGTATDAAGRTKFLAMGVDTQADNADMSKNQYSAAVNIVGNQNLQGLNGQRVLYIDMDSTHDRAYLGTKSGTANEVAQLTNTNGTGGKATTYMPAGSVYIRKGLIELTPDHYGDETASSDQSKKPSANTASGTIRASRFVANNYDATGNRVKYVNPINGAPGGGYSSATRLDGKKVYEAYNGDSKHPYDTYMVNPAYTSVMKDIKLTSRLGARLSDILPDFIVKAIYVSRNAYLEAANKKLEFKTWEEADESSFETRTQQPNGVWASPYLGRVVAPQCPPGYGRVITVVPQEFKMAQVGNLMTTESTSSSYLPQKHGSGYVVNDDYLGREYNSRLNATALSTAGHANDAAGRKEGLKDFQPSYEQLSLSKDKDSAKDPSLTFGAGEKVTRFSSSNTSDVNAANDWANDQRQKDGVVEVTGFSASATSSGTSIGNVKGFFDLDDKEIRLKYINNMVIARTAFDAEGNKINGMQNGMEPAYVLTSNVNTNPITFQQSTWLKATQQALCKNAAEKDTTNNKCNGYTKGWAVMMGFLYPNDLYGDIAANLGTKSNIEAISSGSNVYYWNVFPIKAGTLEAQITTYCYFDNKLITKSTGTEQLINGDLIGQNQATDAYFYNYKNPSSSFEPNAANKAYRKSLNDPALKYDELW